MELRRAGEPLSSHDLGSPSRRRPGAALYGSIVLLSALAALVGFVRESTIAAIFGATRVSDAFYAALTLPFFAAYFVVGGALAPPLTAALAERAGAADWEGFRRLAGRSIAWVSAVGLGAGVLVTAAAWPLAALLAPGFDAETSELAARILRLLVPYGLLTGVSVILGSALTAAGAYRTPAAALLTANAISVAVLAAFAPAMGVIAAAWGLTAGAACAVAVQGLRLRRLGLVPILRGDPTVTPPPVPWRQAGVLLAALAAAGGIVVAERAFASVVAAGAVATLTFADKIVHLPMRFVAAPMVSIAFPRLVRHRARSGSGALEEAGSTGSWIIRILVFCAVVTAVAPGPIVALTFARGRFDEGAAEVLGEVVAVLAPAVVGIGIVEFASRYVVAAGRVRAVLLTQLSALGAYLAAAALLPLGVTGLAAARDIGWAVAAIGLVAALARAEPRIRLLPDKALAAAAATASVVVALLIGAVVAGPAVLELAVVTIGAAIAFFGPLVLAERRRPDLTAVRMDTGP